MNYLTEKFWDTFFNKEILENKGELHAQFKNFGLITRRCMYFKTISLKNLDNRDYILNVLTIRGIFFISINLDVIPFNNRNIIGIIKYDKNQKSFEYSKNRISRNPVIKKIFNKIKTELELKNLKLEKEIAKKQLSYMQFIRILLVSALWSKFITENPNSEILFRVKKICDELKLSKNKVVYNGRLSSIDLVREEALVLNRTYMDNWRSKNLAKKYEALQSVRDDIEAESILNDSFWDAYKNGNFTTSIDNIWFIEFDISRLLTGFIYSKSLIRANYIISVLAIKGMFLITIHTSQTNPKHLGIFYYNDHKKKSIAEYYQVATARENPTSLLLFNKIYRDLIPNVGIEVKERDSGHLPFLRPYKTLFACALWRNSNKINEANSVIDKAEKISLILDLEASSACSYAQETPDADVRKGAGKARNLMTINLYDIDNKWMSLINLYPKMKPQERAEKIALEIQKKPLFVAGAARFSNIEKVKQEAIIAYTKLTDSLYQITPLWIKYIHMYPELTPLHHAMKIAQKNNITVNNVANYGRFSEDKNVRKEAKEVFDYLMERRYKIKERWNEFKKTDVELEPLEIVKKIKSDTKLAISTIFFLGSIVKDETIQKEAKIGYKKYRIEKFGITEKWANLIKEFPHLNEVEQATRVSSLIPLSAYEVAALGRFSESKQVRTKADRAFRMLSERRYRIQERWEELEDFNPSISYRDIISIISAQIDKKPLTVVSYAKYSEDPTIRKLAGRASSYFLAKKYDIDNKYVEIEEQNPEYSSKQIFKEICKAEKKEFPYILSIAICSDHPHIKNEAFKLNQFRIIEEKGIERKWLKLMKQNPELYPWVRANKLADKLKMNIKTLCMAALYSGDSNIIFEASVTRSYLGKQGIFNQNFNEILKLTLQIINESISLNKEKINTALVKESLPNSPLGENAIRNLVALCLKVLSNLDVISYRKIYGTYQYTLPSNAVDIDKINKQIKDQRNLIKIMKGFRMTP